MTIHVRYEHPPIASLLIVVTQEADLISPGFEKSTAFSNHSILDFTLHYGEQRIVLPDDALWKRLCSSSVPPDDDDALYGIVVYYGPFYLLLVFITMCAVFWLLWNMLSVLAK